MKSKVSYLSVLVISVVLCAIVFAGCTHTFKCGICGKEVNEAGHKVTVLGQDIEICDSCYNEMQSMG